MSKTQTKTGRFKSIRRRDYKNQLKKNISSVSKAKDIALCSGIQVTPQKVRNFLHKLGYTSRSGNEKTYVSEVNHKKNCSLQNNLLINL